ncbi:hypothetical protein ACWOB1_00435 [Facklamia languida]|nr:hypothetical protein [Facklamia languida]
MNHASKLFCHKQGLKAIHAASGLLYLFRNLWYDFFIILMMGEMLMTQKKNNFIGTLVLISGIIIGAAGSLLYKENKPLHAGKVLHKVVEEFSKNGKVIGSWIDYDPVEYNGFDSKPLVYMGGITRVEGEETFYYAFATDIYTGEIINTYLAQAK